MSNKTLVYKRWDGKYIKIGLCKDRNANTSFDIYIIENAEVCEKNQVDFDCGKISVVILGTERYVMVTIGEGNSKEEYRIRHSEFMTKVENKFSESAPVVVESLGEYINLLEYYRIKSLETHIHSQIQYAKDSGLLCEEKNEDLFNDVTAAEAAIADAIKRGSSILSAVASNSSIKNMLDSFCSSLREIADQLHKYTENKHKEYDPELLGIPSEIIRSINLYLKGDSFCYYRGVGKFFYPEIPGIFRDNRLVEEDRWYRQMKINFQNELDQKHYLDRLAMLQHYELPTRLIDVTSNPLVALYMAVNTIYTGDKEQVYQGEVIVYFDDYSDNTENISTEDDRYGNGATYICDGKSYDSNVVLMIASFVKLKYESKRRMFKMISTFKKLIDLISIQENCIRRDLTELVNLCIHCSAKHFEEEYRFTRCEKRQFFTKYGFRYSSPNDICKFLWGKLTAKSIESMESQNDDTLYKKLKDFSSEYIKFISSYRYALATVRRENSAFVDHINVFDLLKSYHVKMGMTNDRIQAQAGSFIICGLDVNYVNDKMNCSRRKDCLRIIIDNKKEIAKQLNVIGVNDKSILPDMAHHAGYLKERF